MLPHSEYSRPRLHSCFDLINRAAGSYSCQAVVAALTAGNIRQVQTPIRFPLSTSRDCCLPPCMPAYTVSQTFSSMFVLAFQSPHSFLQLIGATLYRAGKVLCVKDHGSHLLWHSLLFAFVTFFAWLVFTFISYRASLAFFVASLRLLNYFKIWFRTLLCSPVSLDRQIGNTVNAPCVAQALHHACCENTIPSAFVEGKYK